MLQHCVEGYFGGASGVGASSCEGEAPAETEGGVGKSYAGADVAEGSEGWVSASHVAGVF